MTAPAPSRVAEPGILPVWIAGSCSVAGLVSPSTSSPCPPCTLNISRAALLQPEAPQTLGRASPVFYSPSAVFSSRASAVARHCLLPGASAAAQGMATPLLLQLEMALPAPLGRENIQNPRGCCCTGNQESTRINNCTETHREARLCQGQGTGSGSCPQQLSSHTDYLLPAPSVCPAGSCRLLGSSSQKSRELKLT